METIDSANKTSDTSHSTCSKCCIHKTNEECIDAKGNGCCKGGTPAFFIWNVYLYLLSKIQDNKPLRQYTFDEFQSLSQDQKRLILSDLLFQYFNECQALTDE